MATNDTHRPPHCDTPDADALVPLEAAAHAVPCSMSTLRRAIADGRVRRYRSGRRVLVALEDARRLLAPVAAPVTGRRRAKRAQATSKQADAASRR